MPVSQMRNGLTAENNLFSQKPDINVPRSRFDLGRLNMFTSDIGMIVPVDFFRVFPNDDLDLNCQYKIDFRPLVVPTLTSYKVKIHYYYCPVEYLWHGWESFVSKGRSGNLALTIPKITVSDLCTNKTKLPGLTDPNFKTESGSYYPYSAQSLLGYLIGSVPYDDPNDGSTTNEHYLPYIDDTHTLKDTGYAAVDTNALPFLMYQKIYRSNYLDPNLMSNGTVESKVWFPDDIDSSDWRINYGKTNIGGVDNCFFVPMGQSLPSTYVANFVPIAHEIADESQDDYDNAVNLTQLRYSMYTDDMFTSALPFLQRGSLHSFPLDFEGTQLNFNSYTPFAGDDLWVINSRHSGDGGPLITRSNGQVAVATGSGTFEGQFGLGLGSSSGSADLLPLVVDARAGSNAAPSLTGHVNFSAQQLRSLLAVSVWQERNALTNGSYGQFIKVHFNKYPNNQYCEPIYIGGTTSLFNVSAVLQTSYTQTDSEGQIVSPQGNPSGVGGSSNSQSIGRFHVDDFGYVMVLMTVIPDNIYVQSQEHWQFDETPDDIYMPEFEKLSYQPVLAKQLMATGDDSTDNQLFGYSNRYVYDKVRESVARGRLSLPSTVDAYYNAYVQKRIFSDSPKLSQQFVTVYPPNIDRSMLYYPGEPSFIVQFYSGVSAVRAMSYVSQPNTFGF